MTENDALVIELYTHLYGPEALPAQRNELRRVLDNTLGQCEVLRRDWEHSRYGDQLDSPWKRALVNAIAWPW
jgi:hypothetical protein